MGSSTLRRGIRAVFVIALLLGWLGAPPARATGAPPRQASTGFSPTQVVDLSVGISNGAAAWGDFNRDGNPDLLVSGLGFAGTNLTRTTLFLYNADKATLEPIDLGLPQLEASSIAWGDYDNDGYLDLLLSGRAGSAGFAGVYHNVPHTPDSLNPSTRSFVLAQTLAPIYQGTGVWGDYDNDGRLDILISGSTGLNAPFTGLYHNDGGSFTQVAAPLITGATGAPQALTPLSNSAAAWYDYDRDGYPDLAISGQAAGSAPTTLVYHNNRAGGFDRVTSLPGLWEGTVNWIDYAGDGAPGLLLTGNAGTNNSTNIAPATRLYRYDPGAEPPFVAVQGTGLPDVWNSSVSVGDFNNDGYADVALNGLTRSEAPTDVYINQRDGTFQAAQADLPHSSGLALAWGDFNGDQSLDLAVTGILEGGLYHTRVFINNQTLPSRSISAPITRAACWDGGNQLTLVWAQASSSPTPAQALTYNVRVSADSPGVDVLSPSSILSNGYHLLPEPGRAGARGFAVLTGLMRGATYAWSVQAEDASYLGGPFSPSISIPYGTTIALDDPAVTTPNTPVVVKVLQNDRPIGSDTLAVFSVGSPQHGQARANADGSITYTPDENFVGNDSFTYDSVSQPSQYCTQGRVSVSVVHTDKYPPTDISLSHQTVYEGMPVGTLVGQFSAADKDNPLDAFTYTLVSGGCSAYQNNLFTIQGNALRTAAVLDHRHCGSYTIRVRVTDNGGKTFEKDFSICALASAPTLFWMDASGAETPGPASVSMSADGAQPFALSLRANDPGAAEQLTWSIVEPPAHGQASAGGTTTPGQIKQDIGYTPETGWTGQDNFSVRVTDPYGNAAQMVIDVTVTPGNQPPTLDAIPDQVYNESSGPQVIDLSGITPGAGESASQSVTLSVGVSPADGPVQNAQVVYPYGGDPTRGQIQLQVGRGSGEVVITVTLDDHQAARGTFSRQFKVTVNAVAQVEPRVYLPLMIKSASAP